VVGTFFLLAGFEFIPLVHCNTNWLSIMMNHIVPSSTSTIYKNGFINRGVSLKYLIIEIKFKYGDPIIKRDWDPINQFNSATFLCLSHARIRISNTIMLWSFGFNGLK